jgi:serine beta-lactamase-like protein LACTB, mitochondrial
MLKGWNRLETWLTLAVAGLGVVLLGVGGLFIYMSAAATPLFPSPQDVPSAAGPDPSRSWTDAVERARQVTRAAVAEQNLPGVSVAVGVDGAIVWAEGFGWSNIATQARVMPDTRFRIGTASIALTSAAAGLLIEQERLRLADEIQTYVPEFPKKEWPVTVRQLMAHVAGIRNDGGDEGELFSQHCERPIDGVQHVARHPLRFEPGSQYLFSSYGWIVISAAIEAAANEPLLTFMQKHIFEPLRMDDTMVDASIQPVESQATSYFPKFAADPRYGNDLMRNLDYTCYAGASAFLSTPSDLVRFAMAVNSGQLLQPKTVELLQTPQRLSSGQDTGYGLGWDIDAATIGGQPAQWVGHEGDVLGGNAGAVITLRDHRVVVAVLSNTSYAETAALAVKIAEAFVRR